MTTHTLTKDTEQAIRHFESKLAFEMGPIELSRALKTGEPIQIIDLRGPEFYAKGHIPGAQNILLEDLDKHLSKLSKDKTTVVYCYGITCHLSTKAALALAKKGYQVRELVGGWHEYAHADLPVESKAQTSCCSTSKHSCG